MKITLTWEFDSIEELEQAADWFPKSHAEGEPKKEKETKSKKEKAAENKPASTNANISLGASPATNTGDPLGDLISEPATDPLSFLGGGDPIAVAPRITKQELRKKAGTMAMANPKHKDAIIAKLKELGLADLGVMPDDKINVFDDFLNSLK